MSAATVAPGGTSALSTYEPSLDGLRGICIVGVVVYHACAVSGLAGWMRGGFIGVSVFFTLSGFLITSLLLKEHTTSGTIDLRNFWSRRIRRLWPASFVVTLAVLLLSIWGPLSAQASDTIAATWSVTNWHVIAGGDGQLLRTIVGPLGPTWSLAVEEQFYIVLALLMFAVGMLRRPQRALTVLALVGVVVPAVLTHVVTDWHPTLEFSTVLRMPELFLGVLLALWWQRPATAQPGARVGDAVAGVGVAVLVGLFLLVDYSPPWLLRGGYTLVGLVTAATIVGLLQRGRVASLLGAPPLRFLGTISYSLYLVHWPVYTVLTSDRVGFDGVLLVALVLAVAVALAWALHVAVERPVRRMDTAPLPTITAGVGAGVVLTLLSLVAL